MKYVYLVILTGLMVASGAYAQTIDIHPPDSTENTYISAFDRESMVRGFVARRNFSLELRSHVQNQRTIRYAPNGHYVVGAGFFYGKAGLEIGVKLPRTDRAESRYGNTRSFDLFTNYYGSAVGADIIFQQYQGLYVQNPITADTSWQRGDPFPQRPDLEVQTIGGNVYYVFNHDKFSYRAAFAQTEWQRKSAGSFVLMGTLLHVRISGNRAIVPADFGEETAITTGRLFGLALAPGYAYTFVNGRLYASASLAIGPGLMQNRYVLDEREATNWRVVRKNNLRLAAGFISERFQGGASLLVDNISAVRMENVSLAATTFKIRLFAGYRFHWEKLDRLVAKQRRKLERFNRKSRR